MGRFVPLPKIRQLNKHFFFLCCLLEHPCRAAALQGLVRTLLIIKLYPIPYPFPQSRHIVRGMQINILLLDSTPKTLYPYIIFATSHAVHRDTDMIIRQHLLPIRRHVLASLVGVHYLRSTMFLYALLQQLLAVSCR